MDTIYRNLQEGTNVAKETKENYLVIITQSNNSNRDALTLIETKPRAFLLLHVTAECVIPTDQNLTVVLEQHIGNTKMVLLKRVMYFLLTLHFLLFQI